MLTLRGAAAALAGGGIGGSTGATWGITLGGSLPPFGGAALHAHGSALNCSSASRDHRSCN
eukprot:11212507-Prorocentrum_lima.AAC.1